MIFNLKLYIFTLLTLLSIDGIWLIIMGKRFYSTYIGHLMTQELQWWAALVFYLWYALALIIFVISPAITAHHSFKNIALHGFLLGVTAYSAYNLTNQTTLRNWPIIVTVIDTLWGGTVSALTCTVVYYITRFIAII